MNVTPETFKKIDKRKNDKDSSMLGKLFFTLIVKSLLICIIFILSLIYIRSGSLNKQKFKKAVYQNSLSFAKIYDTYQKYLGDVIPFKNIFKDNTKVVSQDKMTYQSVTKENNGYMFKVSKEYAVSTVKSGIVIEVKKNNKYDNIIKIQDKDGLNITYGCLQELNVKLYDYVKKGELLGKSNEKLYMIFEKDNKYLTYDKYL